MLREVGEIISYVKFENFFHFLFDRYGGNGQMTTVGNLLTRGWGALL